MPITIIVRKSRKNDSRFHVRKDHLHKRRQFLGEEIKRGIMTTHEMNKGNEGEPEFDAKVKKYDDWREHNKKNTEEWAGINREFKSHGEEGRPHTLDNLRKDGKKLKFD